MLLLALFPISKRVAQYCKDFMDLSLFPKVSTAPESCDSAVPPEPTPEIDSRPGLADERDPSTSRDIR